MQGQIRALPGQLRGAAAVGQPPVPTSPSRGFIHTADHLRTFELVSVFFSSEGGEGIYILPLYLILLLMLQGMSCHRIC